MNKTGINIINVIIKPINLVINVFAKNNQIKLCLNDNDNLSAAN